ncbi:MAG: RsmD family RNA methyltransferase, partial [Polyangiaceae bacterium]
QVVRVHATSVEKFAVVLRGSEAEPFDLVFADPPYADVADGTVTAALEPIFTGGIREGRFSSEARFVVEHASRDEPPTFTSLELVRKRTYGDTSIAIFGIAGVG